MVCHLLISTSHAQIRATRRRLQLDAPDNLAPKVPPQTGGAAAAAASS